MSKPKDPRPEADAPNIRIEAAAKVIYDFLYPPGSLDAEWPRPFARLDAEAVAYWYAVARAALEAADSTRATDATEYVELTGDDLPYHLRLDAPPLAMCDRCCRQTWSDDEVGTVDSLAQPNGRPCGGRLRPL